MTDCRWLPPGTPGGRPRGQREHLVARAVPLAMISTVAPLVMGLPTTVSSLAPSLRGPRRSVWTRRPRLRVLHEEGLTEHGLSIARQEKSDGCGDRESKRNGNGGTANVHGNLLAACEKGSTIPRPESMKIFPVRAQTRRRRG